MSQHHRFLCCYSGEAEQSDSEEAELDDEKQTTHSNQSLCTNETLPKKTVDFSLNEEGGKSVVRTGGSVQFFVHAFILVCCVSFT